MHLSLMTLNIFVRCLYKFYATKDREELYENYEEMLDYVEKAGIGYIDVTAKEIDLFGVPYLKEQFSKRGISASCIIFENDFLLSKLTFEDLKKIIEKCVEDTAALGCKVIMLLPEALSQSDASKSNEIKQNLIKTFTYATQVAMRNGITVAIENYPDLSLNLCSSSQLEEMLDAVEGLKLVYDSGNMLLANEDPIEYYEKFKGRIGYIHLKDMRLATSADRYPDVSVSNVKMTVAFSGTGVIDFNKLIKVILESGYDGGMTIEFAYKDGIIFPDSLIEAKCYFKDVIERNARS